MEDIAGDEGGSYVRLKSEDKLVVELWEDSDVEFDDDEEGDSARASITGS